MKKENGTKLVFCIGGCGTPHQGDLNTVFYTCAPCVMRGVRPPRDEQTELFGGGGESAALTESGSPALQPPRVLTATSGVTA